MTRRGVEWLSAAADDPVMCRAVWEDDPRTPCLLPTGRLFDVVTIEQNTGLETFDQLFRRCMPFGPVIADHKARRVGFLLNSRSEEAFAEFLARETQTPPDYRYLSLGSAVVVPGPMPLSGDRYQWLHAPVRRPEANPLRPIALATMLVAASELLARVDRYGEKYPSPAAVHMAAPERSATDAG
ncbi:bifunctional DNA primase/polymerase [Streptomyces sp. NPDC047525]|uniref:bifunctional DNA primase/polymerase n=1 Tax=Streptomyces sp. NPDC047525 TaxID=3155264 RepID=UPI0034004FFF